MSWRAVEPTIDALAAVQEGTFSHRQFINAGGTDSTLSSVVRGGHVVREARGSLRLASHPRSPRQSIWLALHTAEGATVVGTTAAWLWGIPGVEPSPVHLAVLRGARRRSPLAVVHQVTPLDPVDVTVVDGIPVTRPSRTLIDVARWMTGESLEDAVDEALFRRMTTYRHLQARIDALAGTGRAGIGALRDALSVWDANFRPDSRREARTLRALEALGLPRPIPQFELRIGRRFIARFDYAWPHAHVALEYSGFRPHGTSRRSFDRDAVRRNRIAATDWTVFDVTEPILQAKLRPIAVDLCGALAVPIPA